MTLGATPRQARRLDLLGADRRRDRQGRPERQRLRVSGRVVRRHRPAHAVQRPRQVLRPQPRRLLLGRRDRPAGARRPPARDTPPRRPSPARRPRPRPAAPAASCSRGRVAPAARGCSARPAAPAGPSRRRSAAAGIAKVTFMLDGRKVKIVARRRLVLGALEQARSRGVHRIKAQVVYVAGRAAPASHARRDVPALRQPARSSRASPADRAPRRLRAGTGAVAGGGRPARVEGAYAARVQIDVFTLFPHWFDWFRDQRHVANALALGLGARVRRLPRAHAAARPARSTTRRSAAAPGWCCGSTWSRRRCARATARTRSRCASGAASSR